MLKEFGYWLVVALGVPWVVARLNRRKVLVLEYHDVYAGSLNAVLNFDGLHVQRQRFASQMHYLAAHYNVIPLDRLCAIQTDLRSRKPLAAITIDDGYKNTYRHAYPILKELDLPAKVFVVSDFCLHGRGMWWDRLRAMIATTRRRDILASLRGEARRLPLVTEQDKLAAVRQLSPQLHSMPPDRREALLDRLAADLNVENRVLPACEALTADDLRHMMQGGISLGSHGCSHDSFLHLSAAELVAELTESKQVLESITGCPVTWLAYPYGEFSSAARQAAIETGYQAAVTTVEGLNDGLPDPYAIRRIGVDDNMSQAHFIVAVSGLRDLLKSLFRIGRAETRAPVPSELPGG